MPPFQKGYSELDCVVQIKHHARAAPRGDCELNLPENTDLVASAEQKPQLLIGKDRAATEAFVRANLGWMLALARRIVKDSAIAEDVVQDAFSNVFKNLETFRGEAALKTWIHRIVVNQALMALRKQRRLNEQPIDQLLPEFDGSGCRIDEPSGLSQLAQTPEAVLLSSDRRQQVLACIDRLPDSYRVILMLRDIEELSTSEVADMTGLTEANVKVRLHRARAALKKLLSPLFEGAAL
ncbi:sigma-70 family RNA polymerase sigma factor [Anderseniella sp. Alg231-50]|uniref:sigma-70 family RNA polymerase sigma factor n=1 Tax=Anderseniella sp. Alg231-50 TaxID=1922226 RepID=UPI00307C2E40